MIIEINYDEPKPTKENPGKFETRQIIIQLKGKDRHIYQIKIDPDSS